MRKRLTLFGAVILCSILHAHAAPPAAEEAALERKVTAISEELRCLVCQNQTIADSSAPLAVDLREQVRDKIRQGKSRDEIIDYMVERYGDFVRYRPPLKASTLVLWFGPALLMMIVITLLLRWVRAKRYTTAAALTDEQRTRAAALLAEGENKGG